MKDTIIFDMDGVIFNSEPLYIQEIIGFFKRNNILLSEKEVSRMVGVDDTMYERLLIEWWGNTSSKEELFQRYERYEASLKRDYTKILNPHIVSLLNYLKKNQYKIALASNSHRELLDLALSQTNLVSYFDNITSGEQFVNSKPNPEIYLHTVKALHSTVENCLIIEDSSPGIEAANRAKIDVLALVDTQYGIDQSQATGKINTLLEVIEYLEGQLLLTKNK